MELRGHEHVVECAVFAPIVAYAAIRELAALGVSTARSSRCALLMRQGVAPKSHGAYVATGSRDKSIRIWETSSGQCLRTFVRRAD